MYHVKVWRNAYETDIMDQEMLAVIGGYWGVVAYSNSHH